MRTYFLLQVTYCRLTIDYLTQKAVRDASFHIFSIMETLTLQHSELLGQFRESDFGCITLDFMMT